MPTTSPERRVSLHRSTAGITPTVHARPDTISGPYVTVDLDGDLLVLDPASALDLAHAITAAVAGLAEPATA